MYFFFLQLNAISDKFSNGFIKITEPEGIHRLHANRDKFSDDFLERETPPEDFGYYVY